MGTMAAGHGYRDPVPQMRQEAEDDPSRTGKKCEGGDQWRVMSSV